MIVLYPKSGFRLNTGMTSEMMPKNGNAMMYTSGCPKNQNRCCQRIDPALAELKTWAPSCRSAPSASSAAARIGNAITTSRDVISAFQLKIGIRNMVMPGARIVMIVVMKFTAPRIVPKPDSARPNTHSVLPRFGENALSDSGA